MPKLTWENDDLLKLIWEILLVILDKHSNPETRCAISLILLDEAVIAEIEARFDLRLIYSLDNFDRLFSTVSANSV